jgi:hypothetical protein
MNIQPRGNGSIRAAEGLVRQAEVRGHKDDGQTETKVKGARETHADHRADRLDVSAPPGGDVRSANMQDRLTMAGAGIEARLENLMQNGDLSEGQLAALAEAKDSFSSILSRLEGAIGSQPFNDPSEVAKGFALVLSQLQGDVHAALAGPTKPEATKPEATKMGGVGAADAKPAPGDMRAAESGGNAAAVTPEERIDNVSQSVAARLANMAKAEGVSGQDLRALAGAEEHFQATLERITNAIEVGGTSREDIQAGFQAALEGLQGDVNAILGQPHGRSEANSVAGLAGVDAEGLSPEDRLSAVQGNVEERLANLLADAGLDERSSAAIAQAQDAFSATLERLQSAVFEGGGTSRGVLGSTFERALAQLQEQVNAALSDASGAPRGDVALYGSDAGITPLSGLDSTGFEQVG